jgi:hypothetical protein
MNRSNRLGQTIGMLAIGLASTTTAAAAEDAQGPALRVRSESVTIVRLIAQATERSATFRREIVAINATDGLVYVHEARCGSGVLACLALTVDLAGPYRLLTVKLDLRRSELKTMSALGHELQHAIEALSDPHVTNDLKMYFFFQQLGPTGHGRFETDAAVQAGIDVFNEVRAHGTGPITCLPQLR